MTRSLPSVLQAKLNLLHDGVEEWLHVTTNSLRDVPDSDECLNRGERGMRGVEVQAYRTLGRSIYREGSEDGPSPCGGSVR